MAGDREGFPIGPAHRLYLPGEDAFLAVGVYHGDIISRPDFQGLKILLPSGLQHLKGQLQAYTVRIVGERGTAHPVRDVQHRFLLIGLPLVRIDIRQLIRGVLLIDSVDLFGLGDVDHGLALGGILCPPVRSPRRDSGARPGGLDAAVPTPALPGIAAPDDGRHTHLLYGSKGMDYLVIPNVKAHMAILRGGGAVKIDRSAHRDIGLAGTHPPKVPGDFRAAGRAPGHPSAIGIAIRHKCLAFSLVHGNAQFFLGPGHRLLHLRCHTPSPQFS